MFVSSAYAQAVETPLERIEDAAEHANRVFPPFDFSHFASDVFWLIISFGLFYLFIARIVVPRIGNVIETRRDRIAADIDQAARMKQEADNAVVAYEKELAEARSSAHTIAQIASQEAKVKADSERKAMEESFEKKLHEAEVKIVKLRDKAMLDVGSIAEDIATEIVHKLLGSDVSKSSVTSAVKAAQK